MTRKMYLPDVVHKIVFVYNSMNIWLQIQNQTS